MKCWAGRVISWSQDCWGKQQGMQMLLRSNHSSSWVPCEGTVTGGPCSSCTSQAQATQGPSCASGAVPGWPLSKRHTSAQMLGFHYQRCVCVTKLKDLPRSVGAQYAIGDQWRTNSRKNEGMEPIQSFDSLYFPWYLVKMFSNFYSLKKISCIT